MSRFKALSAAVTVLVAIAVAPTAASAATTVGQTVDPTGSGCTNGYLAFETAAPDDRYIVPAAGILTSWSFLGGTGNNATLKFKVARPTANPNEFTIVGESSARTPVVGPNTYTDISIPVQAGDVIGFYTATGGDCSDNDPSNEYMANWVFEGSDQSPPGATKTLANFSAYQMNVAASLEADCDGDGFGDETEDLDTASCNPPQPDTDPPKTMVTSGPVRTTARKVRFGFVSDEPGSTFRCRLAGKKVRPASLKQYAPCTSKQEYGRLKPGRYRFYVTATDTAGNADPTPALRRVRVLKRR